MKRSWILGGWLIAMAASAGPALWMTADLIERNPMGRYVDGATGAWSPDLVVLFLRWWLPVAAPVSLLALACMVLNRRSD